MKYKKILACSTAFLVSCSLAAALVCNGANKTIDKSILNNQKASVKAKIEFLLKNMTLDEKIGQMVQGERGTAFPDDVKKYYLGQL
jgi:beta-glucosidase